MPAMQPGARVFESDRRSNFLVCRSYATLRLVGLAGNCFASGATCARLARRALIGLALACTAAAPVPWQDAATGLAIGGFDPTAYFTHRSPVRGEAAHELVWHGAIWRFVNSGNRSAFAAHPEVYAPQFAGYDVTAIADGRVIEGHPAIWAVHANKLYLFNDSVNRRLWSADPERMVARAAEQWSTLVLDLPSAPDGAGDGPVKVPAPRQ